MTDRLARTTIGVDVDGEHRTVAVIAGEDRQAADEALELLVRCLSDGDGVLVAEAGRPADAATWLVRESGRLVRPSAVPGWAPVVVVMDGRAVPTGTWLAPLERALADRSVGAAAPRTNLAAGDELLVGVPYRPDEGEVHRAFVEVRAGDPTVTDVSRLDGPCLAVRRADFEAASGARILTGPAPVAELARRIEARGRRLVVAEGSYLHMAGGPGLRPAPEARSRVDRAAPLVTACLIVKDEEENLPHCLRSLEGFCDEIVVYDTGSTDHTTDLAHVRGATVIEGYWDGDFARARNAALAHCRGQWILWIDADEELECEDRAAARRHLAEMPASTEALIVLIDNVRGTRASTSLAHPACRLFRRAYGHWTGRIHEQVRARAGSPELRTLLAEDVRITHWGYLRSTVQQRAKGDRNVRSAFADLAGVASLPWAARLVSLARSYGLRGQPEEAVDLSVAALAAATEPHLRRLATRTLVDALLALGDPEATLAEVAALRSGSDADVSDRTARSMAVAVAEGRAHLALGRPELALASLARVPAGLDEDGFEVGPHDLAADKARALGQLGRFDEAADTLLGCIRETGGMDAPLSMLLECMERAGRSPHEVAAAVPAERQVAFLGQLVNAEPDAADRALEAWHEVAPSLAVLATAAKVAPSLPFPRRIVWSARLRDHALARACPLLATVADVRRPVAERLLAAALTVQLWGDLCGQQAVTALVAMLPAGERPVVLPQVSTVAPAVASVLRAVAPTPGPAAARRTHAGGDRRVLLVDRQPAALRSMAMAVHLRRVGHRVSVLWPGSAPATEQRLAAYGITTLVWDIPEGRDWQQACAHAVAHTTAKEPYDTVVLAASALEMAGTIRSLVPQAALVADLDDMQPSSADVSATADLVVMTDAELRAAGSTGAPIAGVGASAGELFGAAPPTPWELRQGAVVVGDFAVAGDAERQRWHRTLAPLLGRQLAGQPVVLIGHDPDGAVAGSLPDALAIGAPADPVSWLRAARVAVVATASGATHWRAVAALAGTPVLCAPSPELAGAAAERALADIAAAAGALAVADAAPGSAGPVPPSEGRPRRTSPAPVDPLAALEPTRRPPAPAPGSTRDSTPGSTRDLTPGSTRDLTPRVAWAPGSQLRDHLRAVHPAGHRIGDEAHGSVLEIRGGAWPDLSPRRAERVVVELHWGYATVPVEWIGPLRDVADEVWVPSPWPARVLGAAGLAPATVHVVPPGVDVTRFAPERAPYALRTNRSVRFLFVGACDEASGVDALLEAYLTAFTDEDDVCLVVRPTGPAEHRTFEPDLRRAAVGAPGRPSVEVVDPELPPGDVAGLYRACDVLVHPHRAAGSAQEVLEAMACGRPVVTLEEGIGADVCDQHTGWLVPCRAVRAPSPPGLLVPADVLQFEPRRAALAAALREAAASADRRLCKGLAARDRVVSRYSLDAAASVVAERISALCAASPAADEARSGRPSGLPPTVPAAG